MSKTIRRAAAVAAIGASVIFGGGTAKASPKAELAGVLQNSGITITPSTQVEEHGKNIFDIVSGRDASIKRPGEEETDTLAPKPTPTGGPDGDEIDEELKKIEDKRVQKGLRGIEEGEQALREKAIREIIADLREGTEIETAVDKVIVNYDRNGRKKDFLYIAEGLCKEAGNALKQKNDQGEQRVAQLDVELKKKLIENEHTIMSLKTKYKDKPLNRIKSNFGEEVQGVVDLFTECDYLCSQELINRLKELGIDTTLLKIKPDTTTQASIK